MDVLGDVVSRARRDELADAVAFRHAPTGRHVDYRRFCTTAWKVGNFLRNEGVRGGMDVTVAAEPTTETVWTLYGAGLLGATVDFGAVHDRTKALVAPADRLDDYGAGPRTRQIAYGAEHANPAVAYFERDVWSENPTEPPDRIAPEGSLLRVADRTYSHGAILTAARGVVDRYDLDDTSAVVVREPLAHPGVVAAGFVAPLVAGGTVVVPDAETVGDLAIGDGPEPRTIAPDDVF
ncbi:hypothetical protein [Halorarius litoreus]|uniref:hypothetical protein n=1 Tax=Halorarius litoreus TaxID=2962676 RepID=UPI0020CCCB72|nr:hypothetical protein [Halorarius litoreus]